MLHKNMMSMEMQENVRKPAEHSVSHNPVQEASSKCQLRISTSQNSLRVLHQPVNIKTGNTNHKCIDINN